MKRCCDDVTKLVQDALKLEAKLLGAKKQHDLFDHYMKVLENCRRLKDLFDDIDPLKVYVVLKVCFSSLIFIYKIGYKYLYKFFKFFFVLKAAKW